MMKNDASFIAEAPFSIRSYGKGELAMCYIRNVAQQSAVNLFNEWIRTAPGLEQRLLATGMNPAARRYTPAQVRLMVSDFRRTLKGSSGKLPKRCGCNCRCDSLRFSVTLGDSR